MTKDEVRNLQPGNMVADRNYYHVYIVVSNDQKSLQMILNRQSSQFFRNVGPIPEFSPTGIIGFPINQYSNIHSGWRNFKRIA